MIACKPLYFIPIHEGNLDDPNYNTNNLDLYPKLRDLLENNNVFYGSGIILNDNFQPVQIQLNNQNNEEKIDIVEGTPKTEPKIAPSEQSALKEEQTNKKINDKIYLILIALGVFLILFLIFKIIKAYKKD